MGLEGVRVCWSEGCGKIDGWMSWSEVGGWLVIEGRRSEDAGKMLEIEAEGWELEVEDERLSVVDRK